MPSYKIVVLGTSGVGKSVLVSLYTRQCYCVEYTPTAHDVHVKFVDVAGKHATFEIHDTAGYEQIADVAEHVKGGDAFVLVYSLASEDSFKAVQTIRKQIKMVNTDAPMVLVGTKSDLLAARMVTKEQGKALATEWGCTHVETSWELPEDDKSVEAVFLDLATRIGDHINAMKKEKKRKKLAKCTVM